MANLNFDRQFLDNQADARKELADNPVLHGYCMIKGKRARHYLLYSDLVQMGEMVKDQSLIEQYRGRN